MKKNNNNIDRGEFLRRLGAGSLLASAALVGCGGNREVGQSAGVKEIPTDKMTYRTHPRTGEKISLLGYGSMRWPTIKTEEGQKPQIDQEAVNELVDYAIAHGVNFFDTSPVYCQGLSEAATSEALKRYPRESYFLSTKLSNFANSTRENSIAMYRRSFENLQTDYLDFYLLHSVGGSMEDFKRRYIDNGMVDFLIKEREAGRIRNLGWSFHGEKEVFDQILAMHDTVRWDIVLIQMNYSDWRNARGRNVDAEYLYAKKEPDYRQD